MRLPRLLRAIRSAGKSPRRPVRQVLVLAAAAALVPLLLSAADGVAPEDEPLRVHLASRLWFGTEESFWVGGRFHPRPGTYHFWFERGWEMTPFTRVARSAEIADLLAAHPDIPAGDTALAPAGRVTLSDTTLAKLVSAHRRPTLHLWHAGPHREGPHLRSRLARQSRAADRLDSGLLMPAGRTVAGLWDGRAGGYVALTRPFDVPARTTVEAPLRAPRPDRVHLVVEAQRHKDDFDGPTTLWIEDEKSGRQPAALVIDTAGLATAFWYDLPDRPLTIRAEAAATWGRIGPEERPVFPSRRLSMVPFATLDVIVELSTPTGRAAPVVLLDTDGTPSGIEPSTMIDGRRRFERLIAGERVVQVTTPEGPFWEAVELGAGDDIDLVLTPRPFVVRGRVLSTVTEPPTNIALVVDPQRVDWRIEGALEADGQFELVAQQPIAEVQVALAGGSTCLVQADPPLEEEKTIEIDCR